MQWEHFKPVHANRPAFALRFETLLYVLNDLKDIRKRIDRKPFEICNNDLKCDSNEMLFELSRPARMLTDL